MTYAISAILGFVLGVLVAYASIWALGAYLRRKAQKDFETALAEMLGALALEEGS